MSKTQQEQVEELIEDFELLGTKENQLEYLIDLGRKLPPMDEAAKVEENQVKGCQSTVYVIARVRPEEPNVIEFEADSNTVITKGILEILRRVYSGQPADRILAFDIEALLERLGLGQLLSAARRNGLYEMVRRIKNLAATLVPQTTTSR